MKMAASRDEEASETQDPLLEHSVSSTHDEKKLKWRILTCIDIFLTSTVLCFFIVACWTGTWTLLDIYGEYFPIYESFALSIFIHFVFAMSQKFFHNLLVEKPSKSVLTKCVNWMLHKVYFHIFYVAGIMNWRSGSIIFDQAFDITDDSRIGDMGVILSLIATLLCCTILMWLGAMCNVTSAPMQVSVDCKSETFLFNYKFFRAACILLFSGESNQVSNDSTTEFQKYLDAIKEAGRPFEVKDLGPPPQKFASNSSNLSKTPSPQTHFYKQHQYPKNIQQIISYMTSKSAKEVFKDSYSNGEDELKAESTAHVSISKPDQFYSLKPRDISEVNLLADNHVRFSPPAWKNFQKFNRIPIPIQSAIESSTRPNLINQPKQNVPVFLSALNIPKVSNETRSKFGDVVATVRKPLLVNINISPMEGYHRNLQNPDDSVTDDAMHLQLKVYPDLAVFPEYRRTYSRKQQFIPLE